MSEHEPIVLRPLDSQQITEELKRRAEHVKEQIRRLEEAKKVSRKLFEGFVVTI